MKVLSDTLMNMCRTSAHNHRVAQNSLHSCLHAIRASLHLMVEIRVGRIQLGLGVVEHGVAKLLHILQHTKQINRGFPVSTSQCILAWVPNQPVDLHLVINVWLTPWCESS